MFYPRLNLTIVGSILQLETRVDESSFLGGHIPTLANKLARQLHLVDSQLMGGNLIQDNSTIST